MFQMSIHTKSSESTKTALRQSFLDFVCFVLIPLGQRRSPFWASAGGGVFGSSVTPAARGLFGGGATATLAPIRSVRSLLRTRTRPFQNVTTQNTTADWLHEYSEIPPAVNLFRVLLIDFQNKRSKLLWLNFPCNFPSPSRWEHPPKIILSWLKNWSQHEQLSPSIFKVTVTHPW